MLCEKNQLSEIRVFHVVVTFWFSIQMGKNKKKKVAINKIQNNFVDVLVWGSDEEELKSVVRCLQNIHKDNKLYSYPSFKTECFDFKSVFEDKALTEITKSVDANVKKQVHVILAEEIFHEEKHQIKQRLKKIFYLSCLSCSKDIKILIVGLPVTSKSGYKKLLYEQFNEETQHITEYSGSENIHYVSQDSLVSLPENYHWNQRLSPRGCKLFAEKLKFEVQKAVFDLVVNQDRTKTKCHLSLPIIDQKCSQKHLKEILYLRIGGCFMREFDFDVRFEQEKQ